MLEYKEQQIWSHHSVPEFQTIQSSTMNFKTTSLFHQECIISLIQDAKDRHHQQCYEFLIHGSGHQSLCETCAYGYMYTLKAEEDSSEEELHHSYCTSCLSHAAFYIKTERLQTKILMRCLKHDDYASFVIFGRQWPLERTVKQHLLAEIHCTGAKLQGQLKAILALCTSPNSNLQRPRDVSDAKLVSLMRHLSWWYIMELIEDQPFILYDTSAALWLLQTFDYEPQIIKRCCSRVVKGKIVDMIVDNTTSLETMHINHALELVHFIHKYGKVRPKKMDFILMQETPRRPVKCLALAYFVGCRFIPKWLLHFDFRPLYEQREPPFRAQIIQQQVRMAQQHLQRLKARRTIRGVLRTWPLLRTVFFDSQCRRYQPQGSGYQEAETHFLQHEKAMLNK